MDIPLTPQVEAIIARAVRAGRYRSAVEVIEAAVRLFGLQNAGEAPAGIDYEESDDAVPPQPASQHVGTSADLPLFAHLPGLSPAQPWRLEAPPVLSREDYEKRQSILAAIGQGSLATIEQRVAFILQRFPETRDSNVALAVRYWSEFQAHVLEEWDRLSLDVLFDLDREETIGRIRRHLQNKLRLFLPALPVQQGREEAQREFYEYVVSHSLVYPEIRFYLDETGNEGGSKPYVGIAGLCVMEWKQYAKHHAALARWREGQGWPATIHFSETGSSAQPGLAHERWALVQLI